MSYSANFNYVFENNKELIWFAGSTLWASHIVLLVIGCCRKDANLSPTITNHYHRAHSHISDLNDHATQLAPADLILQSDCGNLVSLMRPLMWRWEIILEAYNQNLLTSKTYNQTCQK